MPIFTRGGLDSLTKLLIHGDLTRPLLDYSINHQTLTATNMAMTSGITPKFSSQCIGSSGGGSLTYPTRITTADKTVPKTIDFWYYATTNSSAYCDIVAEILTGTNWTDGDWEVACAGNGSLIFMFWDSSKVGLPFQMLGTPSVIPSINTWHHIFVQYNGDAATASVGVDGTITQISGISGSSVAPGSGQGYGLGISGYDVGFVSTRYIQEVRVTDKIQRYPVTGTYTVPQRQYG